MCYLLTCRFVSSEILVSHCVIQFGFIVDPVIVIFLIKLFCALFSAVFVLLCLVDYRRFLLYQCISYALSLLYHLVKLILELVCWGFCARAFRLAPFLAALILEEVALDSLDEAKRTKLLNEAEELHLESLTLARFVHGL